MMLAMATRNSIKLDPATVATVKKLRPKLVEEHGPAYAIAVIVAEVAELPAPLTPTERQRQAGVERGKQRRAAASAAQAAARKPARARRSRSKVSA